MSYLVAILEDRFSRDEVKIILLNLLNELGKR